MEKLLFALLACLGLTACDVRSTGDIKDINTYRSVIYCTINSQNNICHGCMPMNSITPAALESAKSITCTYINSDSNAINGKHFHYCVTWVN
jgi:hypothetical protein